MKMKALTALVVSISLAFSPGAFAQVGSEFAEVSSDAGLVTYNDAANCSEAQSIVSAAQNAANERIRDVNETVKRIGTETRTRRACIENLMKLLTFAIPTFPSLTAIITQLVNAFIQNLIGKACAAATNAINGAISDVNDKIRDAQDGVNGVVNVVTKPVTNITKQAATVGQSGIPSSVQQVRREIATNTPPAEPAKSSATSGWKSVSCKIFGGCEQ